jgi:hypothetical protein
MISDDDLRKWSDFLDVQMAHFETCIARETGGPHVADEVNVAFLEADEEFEKSAIREAIQRFIKTNCWPELSARQALHLLFRAHIARGFLASLGTGQLPLLKHVRALVPDSKNHRKFVHWLLIDVWSMGGPAFLKGTCAAFLAERGFKIPGLAASRPGA